MPIGREYFAPDGTYHQLEASSYDELKALMKQVDEACPRRWWQKVDWGNEIAGKFAIAVAVRNCYRTEPWDTLVAYADRSVSAAEEEQVKFLEQLEQVKKRIAGA